MKRLISAFMLCAALFGCTKTQPNAILPPGADDDDEEEKTTLHHCSDTRITNDMLFSSCCSGDMGNVQQGLDYDPETNTIFFTQLYQLHDVIISWGTPKVVKYGEAGFKTRMTTTMGLNCFCHGNNIAIEPLGEGQYNVWAPNFGTRESDGEYDQPQIVSCFPLRSNPLNSGDYKNTDPTDNYYFGSKRTYPAYDFKNDLIAVLDNYNRMLVYRLSDCKKVPFTNVTLPNKVTYGGISDPDGWKIDSKITEFSGNPVVNAHDCTTISPIYQVWNTSYKTRDLHWQTFCIDDGKAYFLHFIKNETGKIKYNSYIEVYDLKTGTLLKAKQPQNYMQDIDYMVAQGYVDDTFYYAEPEGIKVIGDTMYVLYTVRGRDASEAFPNPQHTERRPVVIKLSSDIR